MKYPSLGLAPTLNLAQRVLAKFGFGYASIQKSPSYRLDEEIRKRTKRHKIGYGENLRAHFAAKALTAHKAKKAK